MLHSGVIQSAGQGAVSLNFDSGGTVAFVLLPPVLIGVVTLPLWVLGGYYSLWTPLYRPVGVAALVAFLLFLAIGKAYYPGPLIPVILAASCVQLEAMAARRHWRHAATVAAGAIGYSSCAQSADNGPARARGIPGPFRAGPVPQGLR